MIRSISSTARGAFAMLLVVFNLLLFFAPIFVISLFKLLLPFRRWQRLFSRWLVVCGEGWIEGNRLILELTQRTKLEVRGVESLQRKQWYLVISNHRSAVDILVLQWALNRRIPFLKFFIKEQLKWVPLLGLAWWAMDMPFMKRFSRAYLQRNPHMRGRDLEATHRACAKFAGRPTSVINFVEGHRFTAARHEQSGSPYQNLLPPRAGGIAFVLGAMGESMRSLLDVTIAYADEHYSIWDLCCGRIARVVVDVSEHAIDDWMVGGDYQEDERFRERFQQGLGELWQRKDHRFDEIMRELRG